MFRSNRRRLAAGYQELFDGPLGQFVLNDLLRRAGVLSVSHVPGDAHETAYQEGRRSLGLEIIAELRWTEGDMVALAHARTRQDMTRQDMEEVEI